MLLLEKSFLEFCSLQHTCFETLFTLNVEVLEDFTIIKHFKIFNIKNLTSKFKNLRELNECIAQAINVYHIQYFICRGMSSEALEYNLLHPLSYLYKLPNKLSVESIYTNYYFLTQFVNMYTEKAAQTFTIKLRL